MNYASIRSCDIADGEGIRVALYVSGCRHKCPGCQNEVARDFAYGKTWTKKEEDEIIALCKESYIEGLSILGGEPTEPENQRVLVPFLKRYREEVKGKDVWCWTGSIYEDELLKESPWRCEVTDEFLSLVDILVDGRYLEKKRNLSLKFRGSSNQRILKLHPVVEDISDRI